MSLNYKMEKLNERISFRTTDDLLNYVKVLAESDERNTSYVINKMIKHFKSKGVKNIRTIK